MCKRILYLFSVVQVLFLTTQVVKADPFRQDPGPDGLVVMEAENYDLNTPRPPHTWELITVSENGFAPPSGFSGGYAMQSTPATPAGGAGPNAPADFMANSPRLDYEIDFVKTGTHYIWVLAWGYDGNSDSIHSGLDEQHIPTADRITGFSNNYRWTNDAYQDPERIMMDVNSVGVHTFNIWMREDGSVVDKILITTNPDYTPSGQGPPESHRGLFLKAYDPVPADGELYLDTWVTLAWTPGETAASHDIYIGVDFDEVNDGVEETFQVNQSTAFYVVGFPGFAFPEGLVPGTTYYWRIDEVEADSETKHKGDVWSFTIPSRKAYNPEPADGAEYIRPEDVTLSWAGGLNAKLHNVYFGEDFNAVKSGSSRPVAARPLSTSRDMVTTAHWRPIAKAACNGFLVCSTGAWDSSVITGAGWSCLQVWSQRLKAPSLCGSTSMSWPM
jgi:hypothetical protein